MDERTRLPTPGLDGAGVFAQYVLNWMGCYGPLIEAAGTLRIQGSEPAALAALLETTPVTRLSAYWNLWQDWTGQDAADVDRRLAEHLGTEMVAWVRFALWG